MSNCNNKVTLLSPTRFDYKETVARCGSAAFDATGVIAPQGRYCADHEAEAESDVRCPVCGVGGFKEYQLYDHYLMDCGTEDD